MQKDIVNIFLKKNRENKVSLPDAKKIITLKLLGATFEQAIKAVTPQFHCKRLTPKIKKIMQYLSTFNDFHYFNHCLNKEKRHNAYIARMLKPIKKNENIQEKPN